MISTSVVLADAGPRCTGRRLARRSMTRMAPPESGDAGNPFQSLLGDLMNMLGTNAPEPVGDDPVLRPQRGHRGDPRGQRRAHPADPARAAGPGGRAQRDRGHRHAGLPGRTPSDLCAGGPGRLDASGPRVVADAPDLDGPGTRPDASAATAGRPGRHRSRSAVEDPDGRPRRPARPVGHRHRPDVLRPAGGIGGGPPVPARPRPVPAGHPVGALRRAPAGHRQHRRRSPRTGACPRRRRCCGSAPASWPPTPCSPVRQCEAGWRSCWWHWPNPRPPPSRTWPGGWARSGCPGASEGGGYGPRVAAGDVRRPRGAAR